MADKTYRKLDELKPWDKNPRKIDKEGLKRLKKQIKKLGQYKPLIITEDGTVLGGNMRIQAYEQLGVDKVWVSVVDAKTKDEKLEYALSDNDRAGHYIEEELFDLLKGSSIDLGDFTVDLGDIVTLEDLLTEADGDLDKYTKKIIAPTYEPSDKKP